MTAPLDVEKRGALLVITLNRPEARNSISHQLARELLAALRSFESDPDLRVCVMTGAGGGFCAGMDLREYQVSGTPEDFQDIFRIPLSKPLVSAVEGYAVAGGFELAVRCDLVVAARGARMGLPEVKVGQIAGFGIRRLLRELPRQTVAELALTGALITSERAWELGLLTRLVEPGQALAEAIELADVISRNAPLSVSSTLQLLDAGTQIADAHHDALSDRLAAVTSTSRDAIEGATAFTERRTPQWKGY